MGYTSNCNYFARRVQAETFVSCFSLYVSIYLLSSPFLYFNPLSFSSFVSLALLPSPFLYLPCNSLSFSPFVSLALSPSPLTVCHLYNSTVGTCYWFCVPHSWHSWKWARGNAPKKKKHRNAECKTETLVSRSCGNPYIYTNSQVYWVKYTL